MIKVISLIIAVSWRGSNRFWVGFNCARRPPFSIDRFVDNERTMAASGPHVVRRFHVFCSAAFSLLCCYTTVKRNWRSASVTVLGVAFSQERRRIPKDARETTNLNLQLIFSRNCKKSKILLTRSNYFLLPAISIHIISGECLSDLQQPFHCRK